MTVVAAHRYVPFLLGDANFARVETTVQERWQIAEATVEALRGGQPEDDPTCVLEAVEAVALGRGAEPAVLWFWRQGHSRFQGCLTVQDFIEAVD